MESFPRVYMFNKFKNTLEYRKKKKSIALFGGIISVFHERNFILWAKITEILSSLCWYIDGRLIAPSDLPAIMAAASHNEPRIGPSQISIPKEKNNLLHY